MNTSRALARLTRFATEDALPLARASTGAARAAFDDFTIRLLGRDFEDRLRRVPMPMASGGVDPFGLDPDWAKYAIGVAAFFHRFYFRTTRRARRRRSASPTGPRAPRLQPLGPVPARRPGTCSSARACSSTPSRRASSAAWSRSGRAQTLPFVGTTFSRVGQVVEKHVPENARRLLEQGEVIMVFPEGTRGISKPFSERYRLTEFGLGFMRLALETRTPIVPISVIGAGGASTSSFGTSELMAKALGWPSFPLIPQLFFPGGQLPLPTKYRIYFGEPLSFEGDPDDDDAVIEEKVARVKGTIQSMLNRGLKERKSIFW